MAYFRGLCTKCCFFSITIAVEKYSRNAKTAMEIELHAKQEIWAKLTRGAKAYSISSSVVIVSKIAYHLDSAHQDPNTHRP